MLINEAADAVFWAVATPDDIDAGDDQRGQLPEGASALGRGDRLSDRVSTVSESLQEEYGEDRYRPSPLLRRLVAAGGTAPAVSP